MAAWCSIALVLLALGYTKASVGDDRQQFDLTMPGAKPTKDDQYLCYSRRLPRERSYIVGFEPVASSVTVHHMLVFTCSQPQQPGKVHECIANGDICSSPTKIVFAWGRDAQGMVLPPDVGMAVGGGTGADYVVLQLHYTDKSLVGQQGDHSGLRMQLSFHQPAFLSSILLFAGGERPLPPGRSAVNLDMACKCSRREHYGCYNPFSAVLHPFAFRTHAHSRATQISAFIVRDNKFILIGTQSPQRPQAFYPIPDPTITIRPTDTLVARCTFNTSADTHPIRFGSTRKDEMCNFYLMFYVSVRHKEDAHLIECGGAAPPALSKYFPHPPLPFFNGTEGHHHHHHHEGEGTGISAGPSVPKLAMQRWPTSSPNPGVLQDVELGQVGGVSVHPSTGHVYVFHRGPRKWDQHSFNFANEFNQKLGPIPADTVLVLDASTGKLLSSWGKGLFYMPHGIHVDSAGNVWVTDVGLHQVFKFTKGDWSKPSLTLGTRFEPDDDDTHFCKPADVVLDSEGNVFVADGYCNRRVMKFSASGQLLLQWGARGAIRGPKMAVPFHVPHALTYNGSRLCVADRENGRILCYDPVVGRLMTVNTPKEFNGLVYSIGYSRNPGGFMYAVNYANALGGANAPRGFTLIPGSQNVLATWAPLPAKHFSQPHTLAVGKDGAVYVGEIGPNRLWKFQDPSVAAATAGSQSPQTTASNEEDSLRAAHVQMSRDPVAPAVSQAPTAATPAVQPAPGTTHAKAVAPTTPGAVKTQRPATPATVAATSSTNSPTAAAATHPASSAAARTLSRLPVSTQRPLAVALTSPPPPPHAATTASATSSLPITPVRSQSHPATSHHGSGAPTKGGQAIDFIPAVPRLFDDKDVDQAEALNHAATLIPAATTSGSVFSNPSSVNISVAFILSFLLCALMLLVVITLFQYCRRRSRSREAAPLQKLMGLAQRNGKPPGGGEFSKLQQESSDSDGF